MIESEEKLLKVNNKRKIKESNGMNTFKEDLEISNLYLDIIGKKELSDEEILALQDDKEKANYIIENRYHCILSDVPIFKARQYWDILKKQKKIICVCFSDFLSMEENEEKKKAISILFNEINILTSIMDFLCSVFWEMAEDSGEYMYEELSFDEFIPKKKYNDVENKDDYIDMVNDIFEIFDKCVYYIEDALKSNDKTKYCSAGNFLLNICWDYENIYAFKEEWVASL